MHEEDISVPGDEDEREKEECREESEVQGNALRFSITQLELLNGDALEEQSSEALSKMHLVCAEAADQCLQALLARGYTKSPYVRELMRRLQGPAEELQRAALQGLGLFTKRHVAPPAPSVEAAFRPFNEALAGSRFGSQPHPPCGPSAPPITPTPPPPSVQELVEPVKGKEAQLRPARPLICTEDPERGEHAFKVFAGKGPAALYCTRCGTVLPARPAAASEKENS